VPEDPEHPDAAAERRDRHERRQHRLAYIGIAAAVVLGIGLLAMAFPVYIDDFDQYGWQIKCGTAYVGDLTQAAASHPPGNPDAETTYVADCESALLFRRLWTVPLVAIAGIVGLIALVKAATSSAHEVLHTHHE